MNYRQLGHESEEKKDHRYRPYASHEGGATKVQEWISDWNAKGSEGDELESHMRKIVGMKGIIVVYGYDKTAA